MRKNMFSKKWIQNIIGCAFLSMVISPNVWGFDAPAYFDKKCSGCHTIGAGDEVGPDLKGVADRREEAWIKAFIKNSEAVIKSGDPIANELFNKYKKVKMPAREELTDKELTALYEFLKAGVVITFRPAQPATPEEIAQGKAILAGTIKLDGGGRACLSCHSTGTGILGGGSLGADLIESFAKSGDQAINEALISASGAVKNQVHHGIQISETENFYIRAYLADATKTKKQSGDELRKFALIGILGALFIFTLFDYRSKKRSK